MSQTRPPAADPLKTGEEEKEEDGEENRGEHNSSIGRKKRGWAPRLPSVLKRETGSRG